MAWHSIFGLGFLDLAGGLPLTTPQIRRLFGARPSYAYRS